MVRKVFVIPHHRSGQSVNPKDFDLGHLEWRFLTESMRAFRCLTNLLTKYEPGLGNGAVWLPVGWV
jgi:hypothetical protein